MDIQLLKIFSDREVYLRYEGYVNRDILEPEINKLLNAYAKYYEEFSDKDVVNFNDFQLYFYHYCEPDLTRSDKETFDCLFDNLKSSEESDMTSKVLQAYQEKELLHNLQDLLDTRFDYEHAQELLDSYKEVCTNLDAASEDGFVTNDISSILEQTDRSQGLRWRLNCLNNAIGGLIQGDFGIVAAYVDTGKSTFAASEATFMASQLTEGCVLWLNNEEFNHRVQKRLWMSALGAPWEKIVEHKDLAIKKYKKLMHGDIDRIKLFDIRGFNIDKISNLVKKYNPKLIIMDQVDKIDCRVKSRWKEHDRLKYLYGQVRDIANNICPVIGISQADASTRWMDKDSASVLYQKYLDQSQLDGSKVGKNGEADFIIMIGRDNDYPNIRGISIPKNKLEGIGDEQYRNLKTEVRFCGEKARYED